MMRVVRGYHAVVGAPHPGRMHEGIPPGGAAVPELLAAANAAAGRPPDAPAVEHWGPVTIAGRGVAGTPDGPLHVDGEVVVRPAHRIGYLALDAAAPPRPAPPFDPSGPIRIVLGPDAAGALASAYRVGVLGNRVGVRLAGPAVAATPVGPSAPMVRGAIQVPPSGELIVLGPEHPTTGGYPVAAVVCAVDLGRLFARPPGTPVELVAISLAEARALRRTAPAPSR